MRTRSQSKRIQYTIKSHHEPHRVYENKCILCFDTSRVDKKLYQVNMCRCKGTSSMYHYECLQNMLDNIVKSQCSPYICKTCNTPYNSIITSKTRRYDKFIDFFVWLKNITLDFYLPILLNLAQLMVLLTQVVHIFTWLMYSMDGTYPVIVPPPQIELIIVTHAWILLTRDKYFDYTFMGTWLTSRLTQDIATVTGLFAICYFSLCDLSKINPWEDTLITTVKILFMLLVRRLTYILLGIVICAVSRLIQERLKTDTIKAVIYTPYAKSTVTVYHAVSPLRPYNYVTNEQVIEESPIRVELNEVVE